MDFEGSIGLTILRMFSQIMTGFFYGVVSFVIFSLISEGVNCLIESIQKEMKEKVHKLEETAKKTSNHVDWMRNYYKDQESYISELKGSNAALKKKIRKIEKRHELSLMDMKATIKGLRMVYKKSAEDLKKSDGRMKELMVSWYQ